MSTSINMKALNQAAKVLSNQVKTLESQGYEDMYFTAQFFSGGKKQNGIERGDVSKISKQIRDYVKSEDADTMSIEVFEESTKKSIYRKKFFNLCDEGEPLLQSEYPSRGLGGFNGLGEAEVMELVDRRVTEARRQDEFTRLNQEVDTLRSRNSVLEKEKEELEAAMKAKKTTEYFMGIVGTAFPGLATMFAGTPLAQAAGFLAGTTDLNGTPLPQKEEEESTDDVQIVANMVAEFCRTLNSQEASAIHLLFTAFENDRTKIQSTLHYITAGDPAKQSKPS